MSEQNNIPEKDTAPAKDNAAYIEEGSTIFGGAPTAKKPMKQKSKGRRSAIKIGVVTGIVALLVAGCIMVAVFIPPLVGDDNSSLASSAAAENTLLAKNRDNIKTVKVTGANDSFTIERVRAPASSGSDSSDIQPEFKVLGYSDDIKLNAYSIENLVDTCAYIEYVTKEESLTTEAELARYKLSDPSVTVAVTLDDDSSYMIYFSMEAPSKTGYYCYTSITDGIYIVEPYTYSGLNIKSTDLLDKEITPAPENASTDLKEDEYFTTDPSTGNASLSRIDEFSLSGTKVEKPFTLLYTESDELHMSPYVLKDDKFGYEIDPQKINRIISSVGLGFTASDIYSTTKSEAELKKYNLINPEYIMSYTIKGKSYTIKISAAPGEDSPEFMAAIVDDKPFIYKIYSSSVEIVTYTEQSYHSSLLFVADIKNVSSVKFVQGGKISQFDLSHSGSNDLAIKSGDRNLSEFDVGNFRTLYSELITLSPISYSDKTYNSPAYATITLTFNNGSKPAVIEFIPAESLKYLYRLNGHGSALITFEKVDKLLGDAQNVLDGTKIPD